MWIPGHPHRLTLIIFLKVYQKKLLITLHAILLISLLMHTSLLIYSNYRLISFILPQDIPRLLPAELKFTTAYCFYWQEPEYKGSQSFFQSRLQEGHSYSCFNNSAHSTASGTKSSEIPFVCIIMKSPWTTYSFCWMLDTWVSYCIRCFSNFEVCLTLVFLETTWWSSMIFYL